MLFLLAYDGVGGGLFLNTKVWADGLARFSTVTANLMVVVIRFDNNFALPVLSLSSLQMMRKQS